MKTALPLLAVCLMATASVNAQYYQEGSPGSTGSDADRLYRESQAADARREAEARERERQRQIDDQQRQIDNIRRQQQ